MPLPEIRFLPLSRDLDVSTFSCGHDDLDEFLIEDSMVTLVTDCTDVKQVDPEAGRRGYPYRKYPAIKVARLATSKKHQGNGIGSRMLHEILTLTIMISEYVGCRIITVDAKPESVGFYERFGFKRVKSRRSDPIPMYMDYYRALEEERPPG